MAGNAYLPLGVHLVGSLPVASADEALRSVAEVLGNRVRRMPDGETGPRADWIVWQYPTLSARPEFEIGPPMPGFYRAVPRLRLREGQSASSLAFGRLGYADAALASYRLFAVLKRDGVIPQGCRFQVALPTPLAPVCAFISPEHQAAVEPAYEAAMLDELAEIVREIPSDQLAIQWDTNFEFGMLEGVFPAWFGDVKAGILERLLRIGGRVPPGVELGFHLCYGDTQQGFHRPLDDMRHLVDVANHLAASLDRPLNWLHLPTSPQPPHARFFERLSELRIGAETELFLGLLYPEDGVDGNRDRVAAAREFVDSFGIATECGLGRRPRSTFRPLLDVHRALSRPISTRTSRASEFAWPAGFARIPAQDWVSGPIDEMGVLYDRVETHGWYKNLDPTVDRLARELREGDLLIDYSGGTGILVDRLRLRVFDLPVGMLIVDASPKFLRVALERHHRDARVAFRLLRYLGAERRLERLEEVLDGSIRERGADAIVSTNAVHLYPDLSDTLASWKAVLRPGGKIFINSGNIRNPAAQRGEWILDETVYVVTEIAMGLVRTDTRYAGYRDALEDRERLRRHVEFRDRVFLPPRPLDFYVGEFERAGLHVEDTSAVTITADVDEWFEFLRTYHEAVLGWVGGSLRIDGRAPTEAEVADRLALIRDALGLIFGGRRTFPCCWTYIAATR